MNHLTFEQLSDLAEGGAEHPHVVGCAECRATLERVRALVVAARALPREIEPPPEVWGALRERVARTSARPARRWWHNGWLATAAAIVLVIGTALITSTTPRAKAKGAVPAPVAERQGPNAMMAVERNYSDALSQLRETLDSQRSDLAPSTVRTVDRALAVIDSAIAEARQALSADPANAALVDILSAHYERKVELLQRATELSSSL
jgi:hypothetical protein